jgi:phenylacetate-CoA ligase
MSELERAQRDRLRLVLRAILAGNAFYRDKLAAASGVADLDPETFELADLARLPFTSKEELVADQQAHPPFGRNLSFPIERYVRMHQTSGTRGRPLRWLDTGESWEEFLASWSLVYDAAGVTAEDRVFVAFSFGPFLGFWGAFEAAQRRGALTLTGGSLSTEQRLEQIHDLQATVVVSTPTYALHLVEAARRAGSDLRSSAVRLTVHAGEPGASVPAVRARIEEGWGARCYDHAGATELGAWGRPGPDGCLYVDDERFLAELVDPASGAPLSPAPEGTRGELVLTSLGRVGSPLLRYRTGDLVEMVPRSAKTPTALRGGVLGRIDDMFVVRAAGSRPPPPPATRGAALRRQQQQLGPEDEHERQGEADQRENRNAAKAVAIIEPAIEARRVRRQRHRRRDHRHHAEVEDEHVRGERHHAEMAQHRARSGSPSAGNTPPTAAPCRARWR